MRAKFVSSLLVIICFVFASGHFSEINAQEYNHRDVKPQLITLFSQHKYKDFAKANFNFQLGVRGDSTTPRTYNNYDLRYSGNSPDGKLDWFDISISKRSYSQIEDMGALNWDDIYDIPLLTVSSEPHNEEWKFDCSNCINNSLNKVKITPENALVKVIAGHMYLIHIKESNYAKEVNKDLYAMFRVESLKSGDEVTISWKIVPSPENNKQ